MSLDNKKSQLKVCCTCGYWSFQHKGFCHRLEEGAGKFWMCEDWRPAAAAAADSLPDALNTARVGAALG